MMWYYQENYQRIGPIDSAEVERLIREGQISRSTKVWREGMADWQPAIQTELRGIFLKSLPPPIEPPPVAAASRVDDEKRLNTWFMGYWICLMAVLLMIVAAIILPKSVPLFIKSTVVIAIGGAAVSACVLYLFILRKLWSLIPVNQAKTTPGKTVGFCLIPFFGLYWNFIAIHGLAKALNVETNQNLVENRKVNEGLSLSVCIIPLTVFGALLLHWAGIWIDDLWIRALGNVLVDIFCLALFVLGVILLRQMKNAGITLVQKQLI